MNRNIYEDIQEEQEVPCIKIRVKKGNTSIQQKIQVNDFVLLTHTEKIGGYWAFGTLGSSNNGRYIKEHIKTHKDVARVDKIYTKRIRILKYNPNSFINKPRNEIHYMPIGKINFEKRIIIEFTIMIAKDPKFNNKALRIEFINSKHAADYIKKI